MGVLKEKIRDIEGKMRRANLHLIEVPVGEYGEKRKKKFFQKVMAENFPDLMKDMNLPIQGL